MSVNIEDDELDELRKAFTRCDVDDSGAITSDELHSVYKEMGQEFSQVEIEEMMSNSDLNNDGYITFNEFLRLYKIQKAHEIKLRKAFEICDCDGNQFISFEELQQVMKHVQGELSKDQLRDLLNEADLDGDASINFEEFIHLTKIKNLF